VPILHVYTDKSYILVEKQFNVHAKYNVTAE